MPKGWPQDQTDLRRPYSDEDSTSPGQAGDGRADSVRRGGWDFGPNHPSGPLPIGPVRDSRRGRSSRRSREGDWPTALDMGPGDEDYDWIRYLGEAGPAQDTRPSAGQTRSGRQRGQDSEPERRLPRRHARPDPSGPAAGSDETASWPSDPGPQRPARHRHSAPPNPALPDPGRVVPAPIDDLHLAPERGRAPRRPQGDFPPAPTGPGARGSHRRAAPPAESTDPGPGRSRWPSAGTEGDTRWPTGPVERIRPGSPPSPQARSGQARARQAWADDTWVGERRPRDARPAALSAGLAVAEPMAPTTPPVKPAKQSRAARRAAVQQVTAPKTVTAPRTARIPAKRKGSHRGVVLTFALLGAVCLAGGGFAGWKVLHKSLPAHAISTPQQLLGYTQEPKLANSMGATKLRDEIVAKSNGEASHVSATVYEDSSGAAAKTGPQIILFIGGNLSGSADSFISSFTGMLHGAFITSAGKLGGHAACVPGYSGHPAECAWADNDTFGLISSPTLSAADLGNQLRAFRPLVEHVVK